MTYFNPFLQQNFSIGETNNLFTPSVGVSSGFDVPIFDNILPSNFNCEMPSFFNFMPALPDISFPTNITNIFSQPMQFNFDAGNFNNFSNFTFNFSPQWNFSNTSFGMGDTFTRNSNSPLRQQLVDRAKSYVGRVNSDREGNRLFSKGQNRPWCADFVAYNIKQIYGSRLPASFSTLSSVYSLRQWGIQNNCYKQVPNSGKASFIANNVKAGDIMIEKKGGKSHTGIVTKVNSDGSFETVEGNCSNSVKIRKYKANSSTLSGFVSMDRYA